MLLLLGLLTIVIAMTSYGFYITDMIRGKTQPHSLTWLIWSALNTFIFFQQLIHEAGPGAWVTGVAALANGAIFLMSFKYGDKRITLLDWLMIVAVLAVIVLWLETADTLIAVILSSVVFALGFIPTIAKAWKGAHEETLMTYALNSLKFLVALFALQSFTLITALYPVLLFLMNLGFVIFLIARRRSYERVPLTA